MPTRQVVLVDTCVLINLIASGHIEDVINESEEQFMICSAVEAESIFLRQADLESLAEEVQIKALVESGRLHVCSPANEEEESLYVDYASHLDDGEAMSLALAQSGGFVLATDDKKARRLFLEAVNDPARLTSTAAILRRWAERQSVSRATLRTVLTEIGTRARFFPSTGDPDYAWWCDFIS